MMICKTSQSTPRVSRSCVHSLACVGGAAAMMVATLAPSAQAQNWTLFSKVFHPNSAPSKLFGQTVAIDGTFGVVAATGTSIGYSVPGSAVVFDLTTGNVLASLTTPGGGFVGDEFAISVDLSGNRVIVGASNVDSNQGVAYIFDRDSGTELLKLIPAGNRFAFQQFGRSVAADGDLVVVGARNDNVKGFGSGAAYLFDLNTGTQLFQLSASDGGDNHLLGDGVAIHGDLVAAGAPSAGAGGLAQTGAVYVFDATTGAELYKVTDTTPQPNELFGSNGPTARSLALNDDYLVVGIGFDNEFGQSLGSVAIFDAQTGAFVRKIAPSASMGGNFGVNVDVVDDRVATFARAFGRSAVFVYELSTGLELQVIDTPGLKRDEFGSGIGMSDTHLLVGAPWDDDNGTFSGAAYIFDEGQLPPIELVVTGTCPGPMSGVVSNCTPGGDVVIFYGLGTANRIPPSFPCGGLIIDVGGPRFGYLTAVADANGNATNGRNAPPLVCGRVRVQALDTETCRLSNVITIN